MTDGGQPIISSRLGIAFETYGALAAAPTVYIIAGGKFKLQNEKKNDEIQVSGNRDPAMIRRGGETSKVSIPMMALVDDNGLGELLLGTFGTDTPAQCGATAAYDHVFTANDTAKTMTVWVWDTLKPKSARMMSVDSMKIEVDKEKNTVDFTFDLMGAEVRDSSTFGSASYINPATEKPNLMSAGQSLLMYGEPLANVRHSWKKLTITSKENMKFGPPGKNAPIPAGSSSPKISVKGKRATTIEMDIIDTDGVEQMRCRAGGNVTPTATEEADNAALVAFKWYVFGSSIAAGLNVIADINNTATVAVANLATYSTAQGSNADLTFTARTPGVIPTITYAAGSALAVAVANVVDITVTLDDSPATTADDIKSAIEANTAANLLVSVARKTGQTGVGTPSAFTVQPLVAAATGTTVTVSGSYTGADVAMLKVWVDANGTPDTFSWQLNGGAITTGVAITGSAQVVTAGISVAFSSTTGGTVGDTFYIFTHYQRMLSFTSLTNALEPFQFKDTEDFYEGTIKAAHESGPSGTKPSMTMRCERTTAFA